MALQEKWLKSWKFGDYQSPNALLEGTEHEVRKYTRKPTLVMTSLGMLRQGDNELETILG